MPKESIEVKNSGATGSPSPGGRRGAAAAGAAAPADAKGLNNLGEAFSRSGTEDGLAALLAGGNFLSGGNPDADDETGQGLIPTEGDAPEDGDEALETSDEPDVQADGETAEAGDPDDEATEDGDGEAQEDGAEEGETDGLPAGLPAGVQKAVAKRIGKEVRKTREAVEALEAETAGRAAAEARVAELEAAVSSRPVAGQDGLASVTSMAELDRHATEAEGVVEFADRLLNRLGRNSGAVETALRQHGVKLQNAEGEDDFTPERMEVFLEAARDQARQRAKAIPARREFLTQREQHDKQTVELFPWFKNANSPEFKEASQILKSYPMLNGLPHAKLAVAVQMLGMRELKKMVAAKAKPMAPAASVKAKPPIQPGTRRTAAVAPNAQAAERTNRMKKLQESGSLQDLVGAIGAVL